MKWINVNSQVPECATKCLATDGIDIEIMMFYGDYKGAHEWSSSNYNTLDVTHWMPLPIPPQE